MIWVLQIIISSVATVTILVMVFVLLQNGKNTKLRNYYLLYMIGGIVWSSGEIMITLYYVNYQWLSNHGLLMLIRFIESYKYLAIAFHVPVWLLFCMSFSYKTLGSFGRTLFKHKWLLFLDGVIFYLLLIKNDEYQLIYYWIFENGRPVAYFGWVSYIHAYIGIIMHLYSLYIVLKHTYKSYSFLKKQTFFIIISVFIPAIIVYIYCFMTDLFQKTHNFDIVPSIVLLTILLANFAIFRYRFLNITPVAFPKMADELRESILIVDADGMIAYFNRAFKETFKECELLDVDSEITHFANFLNNNVALSSESEAIIQSIKAGSRDKLWREILFKSGSCYTVTIQPLFVKKDFIGQIITFYDVTDYKKLLSEIQQKNEQLQSANVQLKEYAETAEELAVTRERNRFTGDVHDSVGHTMTVLISLIGVCSIACDKDSSTVKQKLEEMMKTALKGHDELRSSVLGIMPSKQNSSGVVQKVNLLVEDFEKTGVRVNFSVNGEEDEVALKYTGIVYRICQEALTNSLRHGKAVNIDILLRFTCQALFLYIFDDGIGCKTIKKNIGLTYMEKRVQQAGGKITYGSDGEKGFNILVEIPYEVNTKVVPCQ